MYKRVRVGVKHVNLTVTVAEYIVARFEVDGRPRPACRQPERRATPPFAHRTPQLLKPTQDKPAARCKGGGRMLDNAPGSQC